MAKGKARKKAATPRGGGMKFSVDDLVWANPKDTEWDEDTKELGLVIQVDCVYQDEENDDEERQDGIMVKFQVGNYRRVLPPTAVRPYDEEEDNGGRRSTRRRTTRSPVATGDAAKDANNNHRSMVTPSPSIVNTSSGSDDDAMHEEKEQEDNDTQPKKRTRSTSRGRAASTTTSNKKQAVASTCNKKKNTSKGDSDDDDSDEEDTSNDEKEGQKSPYFNKAIASKKDKEEESDMEEDADEEEETPPAKKPAAKKPAPKKPAAWGKKTAATASKKAPTSNAKKSPANKKGKTNGNKVMEVTDLTESPQKKEPAKKPAAKKKKAPAAKKKKGADEEPAPPQPLAEWDDGQDSDDDDKPYKVEYAPSGRSTCRRCDEVIPKGCLRLSHVPLFRGKPGFRVYRHLECMVLSADITRVEQIGGWRNIRRQSQEDYERLVLRIEESRLEAEEEEKELRPDELVQVTFQGEIRKPPKGLSASLLPFQTEGVSWMYHQEVKVPELHGGILADEMGMGKTLQTITTILDNRPVLQHSQPGAKHPPNITGEALEKRKMESDLWDKSVKEWHHEMEMNNVPKKMWPKKCKASRAGTLVICPVIALLQWKTELEKFTEPGTLSIATYHGPNRAKEYPLQKLCKYDIVLTTYQVLEADFRKMVSPNKVTCPNCGGKFKIDKLRVHLKYFCGDGAQRTEAQMRQQRTAERHNRGGGSSGGGAGKSEMQKKKSFTKTTSKKKSFAKTTTNEKKKSFAKPPTKKVSAMKAKKTQAKYKGGKRGQPIRPSSQADDDSESEDEDMAVPTPTGGRPSRSAAVNASKRMSASMNDWTADAAKDDESSASENDDDEEDDDNSAMSYDEEDSDGDVVPSKTKPAKKAPATKKAQRKKGADSDESDDDEPVASKKKPAKKTQTKKRGNRKKGGDSDPSDDEDSSSEEEESPAMIRARQKQAEALKRARKAKGKGSNKKPPLKGSKKAAKKGKDKASQKGKGKKKKFDDDYNTESESSDDEPWRDPLEGIDLDALMQEAMEGSLMSVLHSVCWWRICLDEAHMIKSRSSQTAAAAFSLVGVNRWALSGTPLQNRVGELYSLIRFIRIDPMAHYFCRSKGCNCKSIHYRVKNGVCQDCGHRGFQHYSHFNKHVLNPIQRDGYSGDGRRAMFKLKNEVLDKCLIRRTKETRAEDMNLPPRIVTIRTINLHPIEKDFYDALYTQTKSTFSDYVAQGTLLNNYAHIFDLLTRMRQAVDHPYLIVYSKRNCDRASASGDSSQPLVANGSTDCDLCHELPTGRVVSTCCGAAFCRSCVLEYVSTAVSGTDDETPCPSCGAGFSIDLNQADQDIQEEAESKNDGDLIAEPKQKDSRSSPTDLGPSLKELPHVNSTSVLRRINLAEFATSTKIEALVQELVEMRKARPGSKALVFSQFVNMLDLIRWRLHSDPCLAEMGLGVRILHGSMNVKSRDAALKDFREDGSVRVLLMSLKSGGVALNLTVASEVFLVDNWWNPAAEMQAIDRTHRLGQHRCIRAVRFIAEGTVEERVLQLQEKKRLVFDGTVGRDAGSLKMLTAEDMKCLFA